MIKIQTLFWQSTKIRNCNMG